SLTDDLDLAKKWQFPTNTVIAAGGYLLVLCDGREEANAPKGAATMLHSNFKLAGEGELLALLDSFCNYIDGLPAGYPLQGPSCSFGRNPQNSAQFGFLSLATPGEANRGPFFPGQVDQPGFEDSNGTPLPGGIYTQAQTLRLTCATPGSTIRYTLDG